MEVFDVQARIGIDTTPYLEALRQAARETETLRQQMSQPINPLGNSSQPSGNNSNNNSGGGAGGSTPSIPEHTAQLEKAGKAVDELTKKLGQGFKAAAKVGAAAWGTFSAAAVAATKKAVDGFAQYEQLVGGVDTIFKESSEKVQEYAANAYKTAGMSANQYMETVTSFSMSLLQGLEGDTEKAAEYADLAIRDMSDNANKMGTSMASIEHAYQGFAKQNYTMLDNLKLGYGGTKSEMERLLEDAGKLAGMKFELGNYGDIVQAIHVIQKNLDITGTTAKEAADTIEGSMNSTKAAIENLVVGFARSDANIDKLIKDVEDNVKNVAKNTIPVAERAFVSMSKSAISAGKEILDKLPRLISSAVTSVHKTVSSELWEISDILFVIESATKAAAAAFVTYKAVAYAGDVIDSLKAVNAALKEGVTLQEAMNAATAVNPYALIAAAVIAAGTALKSYVDIQTDLINETGDYYNMLSAEQKQYLETAAQETEAIRTNAAERKKNINTTLDEISTYQTSIDRLYELDSIENKTAENKAEMAALVEELNSSIDGLNIKYDENTGKVKTNKKSVDELIDSWITETKVAAAKNNIIKILGDQEKAQENLKISQEELNQAQEKYHLAFNRLQGARKAAEGIIDPFGLSEESKNLKAAQEAYDVANDEFARWNKTVEEQKNALAGLDAEMKEVRESLTLTADETAKVNEQVDEAVKNAGESIDKSTETITHAMGVYKDKATDTVTVYAQVKHQIHEFTEEQMTDIAKLVDAYDEAYEAQYEAISKSVDLYSGFEADTSTTYNDLYNNLQQSAFYLDDWTTAIDQLQGKVDQGLMSQEFLDSLKSMGLDSWSIVYDMNHATGDQLKQYSDLWDKTNENIKNSTDTLMAGQKQNVESQLESITGIAGAKIENYRHSFELLGANIGEGLEKGITDKIKDAENATEDMGNATIEQMETTLDEHSPSKEFQKIGEFAVKGFAIGMYGEETVATNAARNIARAALEAMREELEISSPSKVMKKLGAFTGEGFALGMESKEQDVLSAAEMLAGSATDPLDGLTPTAVVSSTRSTAGGSQGAEQAQPYVFNLVTPDGFIVGQWLAPFIEAVQGKTLTFTEMGYAT